MRYVLGVILNLLLLSGFAQTQPAELQFFTTDSSNVKLYLNDNQINDEENNIVYAKKLSETLYDIKLEFTDRTPAISLQLYPKSGFLTEYAIVKRRDTSFVRFFRESKMTYDANENDSILNPEINTKTEPSESEKELYPDRICKTPMSNSDFSAFKRKLQSTDFESDKLSSAKSILKSECLSSEQVRQICGSFDFEESRIEFAKLAYKYTVDIDKFSLVYDTFEFLDSIYDFEAFRKQQK